MTGDVLSALACLGRIPARDRLQDPAAGEFFQQAG